MPNPATIGAGGDYLTVALWQAYLQAQSPLSEPYTGKMVTGETIHGADVDLGASVTTTAANNILFTAANPFTDNLDTNALTYDTSNGSALAFTSNYHRFTFDTGAHIVCEKLMFRHSSTVQAMAGAVDSKHTIRKCLVDLRVNNAGGFISNGSGLVENCWAIATGTSINRGLFQASYGALYDSCTAIRPTNLTTAGYGFRKFGGGTYSANNCLALGAFTSCFDGSISGDYNGSSDATAPGTNNERSLTTADEIENATSSALDIRLKSTNTVKEAGSTSLTEDGYGTSRPQGSADTLGAEEYLAGAPPAIVEYPITMQMGL